MIQHQVRINLYPLLHRLLDEHDYYAAYTLDQAEHVGTLQGSLEDVRGLIRGAGYQYNLLAAAKWHWETGETDDGSYRKVDPHDPEYQYHVHLFDRGGEVQVTSHYEIRPEPHQPYWDLERSLKHYHPDPDAYLKGVAGPTIQDLL